MIDLTLHRMPQDPARALTSVSVLFAHDRAVDQNALNPHRWSSRMQIVPALLKSLQIEKDNIRIHTFRDLAPVSQAQHLLRRE